MNDIHIIVICLIAVGLALFTVSYINSMQTRKRLIKQRLAQLKRQVSEMEELASAVGTILGDANVEKIVLEEIIDTVRGMQQLEPKNVSLELTLESLIKRIDELSSAPKPEIYRIFESDAQIARARHQITEAGRIIRKRESSGLIEAAQMTVYIEELAWAHLMVHAVSLVAHGHKAAERSDVLRAYSYYKKAQEAAMGASSTDQRVHKLVKELGELQSNRRKLLSSDLMPEGDFNIPES